MSFFFRLFGLVRVTALEEVYDEELLGRLTSLQSQMNHLAASVDEVKQYLARQEEIARMMLEQGDALVESDDKMLALSAIDETPSPGKKGLN